jgi:hypothetical protein
MAAISSASGTASARDIVGCAGATTGSSTRAYAVNNASIAKRYEREARKKRRHVAALGLASKRVNVRHQKALGTKQPTGSIQEANPHAEAAQGIAHNTTRYGLDIAAVAWPVLSLKGNIL